MNTQTEVSPTACGRFRTIGLFLVVATLVTGLALPASAGQFISHNTPGYVATAPKLGVEDPSKTIEVSIWLKPHNQAALDRLARELYDRTSPNYRHWLRSSDIASRFAPTAAEAKSAQEFFESHNLKVVNLGPNNFFVRARGTVGDVEKAFQVQLNDYQVRDETLRANDRDPYIDSDVAAAVLAVAGLDSGHYTHPLAHRPTSLPDGRTLPAEKVSPGVQFFSSDCFTGVTTQKYSTDGTFPKATYTGNAYFTNAENPGCAYTPPEIYTAYNLNGLYNEGFNGAGQTIAIIDWCGSLTIESDANAFSAKFGLPLLNSSNFTVIQTPTQSSCAGPDPEINIDVEWAHAIAPGANIDLVVPPSASFQDVDQGVFYAVNYDLGNTISGSYGSPESETLYTYLDTENLISEIAAITGISTNFASGDEGDFTDYGISPTVSAPADSPYATGVGGVSLALNSNNTINWQSGWGTDETILDEEGIFDPPLAFGFIYGSGGGASNCAVQDYDASTGVITCIAGYPKPSFQSGLSGSTRLLPDISWLADPFTGAVIFFSEPGETGSWFDYGGTSLATPMFSGLWAIANEEAGPTGPLGQAAQYLYSLPSSTILDVVPYGSSTNVTASIQESTTVTNTYNADQVMGVSGGTFYSGIWNYPFEEDFVFAISFGTDSSLATGTGWDDVTGVGTPNGQAFADWFAPSTTIAK
jgi:subtilase family serine protease